MKTLNNFSLVAFALLLTLSLVGPVGVSAVATAPDLGDAASFSVLANPSMSADASGATVSDDLGLSTGLAASRTGTWTVGGVEYFGAASLAGSAQVDAGLANISMAAQTSDGAWSLNPAPAPGVWTAAGDPVFSGTLTLTGSASDIWVFQITDDFTFTGDVVLAGGAQACNVYWQVGRDATINGGAGDTFVGTLVAGRDVSLVGGVTVDGRILANGAVTTAGVTSITIPTCVVPPLPATLTLIKTIVGGSRTLADFPLTATGPTTITGVSASTSVTSVSVDAGTYTLSEATQSDYTAGTWSCLPVTNTGDSVTLAVGESTTCTIQNTYITPSSGGGGSSRSVVPPLIDIVKVPSPLALPAGPGLVVYTYTLRNIGLVPVTDVTLTGETCSPIKFISGDTDEDSKLDTDETWVYTCSVNLSKTHTNTVVANGWANGISATDIANATVVVGASKVPPLIHVTKVPSTLATRVGGLVTYVMRITNPGIVALTNVRLTDDKCRPLTYVSGDLNRDSKLDTNETWVYTCRTNLMKTTTNTAVATGQANGISVQDFAIVTVVVVPGLPNTGYAPLAYNSVSSSGQAKVSFGRSLSLGLQGDDVARLQTALEQKGLLTMPQGVAKGYYGNLTRKAVTKYQEMTGLPLVGIFGPLTRAKLISDLGE